MNVINCFEKEQMLKKDIPLFFPGDTVVVKVKVIEGTKVREQAFEGFVIAKRNKGYNSSIIVRKISNGVGVERTFQSYSPIITNILVKRKGKVRKAKLYYMRNKFGKAVKIKEKLFFKEKK